MRRKANTGRSAPRAARLRRFLPRAIGLCLVLTACGAGGLEVKGAADRVVGETVTLALTKGEPTFTPELSLKCADGATLLNADLQAVKVDDRTLTFVIPAGIAAGKATAVARQTKGGTYEIPLRINRLALTLDSTGGLDTWALAPATLPHATFPTGGTTGAAMAISPTGGEVAVAAADQVRLLALGPTIKDVGVGIQLPAVTTLAAASGGRVLAATDQTLNLIRFGKTQSSPETISFKGIHAIAVVPTSDVAMVLYTCESPTTASCLKQVMLSPSLAEVPTSRVQLDAGAMASHIAVTRDGKGVVVADSAAVFGIYIDTTVHKSKLDWKSDTGAPFVGTPVGVTRAPTPVQISGQEAELFAVAEQTNKQLLRLAFNPANHDLQPFRTLTLNDAPVRLAFGPHAQLYVAAEHGVVVADAVRDQPAFTAVAEVTPGNSIVSLAIQP
jgi:hypothetical protein